MSDVITRTPLLAIRPGLLCRDVCIRGILLGERQQAETNGFVVHSQLFWSQIIINVFDGQCLGGDCKALWVIENFDLFDGDGVSDGHSTLTLNPLSFTGFFGHMLQSTATLVYMGEQDCEKLKMKVYLKGVKEGCCEMHLLSE